MSREPSSAAHRYREALGRAGALDPPPPEPAPSKPRKGRNFRVVVPPKRGPESTREAALTKLTTTTEALTVNELALLRELRQTDADNGRTNGDTAGGALSKIERAKETRR